MKNFAKELGSDFINLFFPKLCMGCMGVLIPSEKNICVHCQLQLPFTYFHLQENNPVKEKFKTRLNIRQATALCYFQENSIIEKLLYQLKYRGQKQLGAYFGTLLGKELKSSINYQTIDAIIAVPLHQKRQRKRGYNQVSLFGKTIAHYLGVPYIEDALVRTQNTKQLTKNYYADREKILENAFCLNLKDSAPKHWLLVDDIITTGATLNFCGRLILENPKNELSIAAIGYRI